MEPLQTVPSRLSGGGRAVTPLKADSRSGTPSRFTIGPRSSSAPKGRSLAIAIADAAASNHGRYLSRRKERVRQNNNLVHSGLIDAAVWRADDIDGDTWMHRKDTVNWKSAFAFILNNDDNRQMFLNCDVMSAKDKREIKIERKESSKLKAENELEAAQSAWGSVEKRLRDVVERIIHKPSMADFVMATEQVLLDFHKKGIVPIENEVPIALLSYLDAPLLSTNDKTIVLDLKESAFLRLLVHAVAKYHGLTSKSTDVMGRRVTAVSKSSTSFRKHCTPLGGLLLRPNSGYIVVDAV